MHVTQVLVHLLCVISVVQGYRGSANLVISSWLACTSFQYWNSIFLSYTANFPEDVVEGLPSKLESGVYFGWASVDQGPVYKMVMSIGWNPQFQNEKRSMVSVNVYILYTYVLVYVLAGMNVYTN